jgi:hypothetical protein
MNQYKIANTFNNYFLSIADLTNRNNNNYTNTQLNNPRNCILNSFKRPFTEISWQYASTHEIEKIIKSLKTKNTAGYDEISIRILKLCAPFIISLLTYTCNAVFCSGVFRDRLKYAIFKPVFLKREETRFTIIDQYLY